ncbi:MAG: serine/threonine protein kinase [Gemmatimonadetes bacterium]|nr:serine/threonine protein kinase [Gemmatimonadota bacterium]
MTSPDGIVEQLAPLLAGQYSLERELGRGGMGVVYLARETRLERPVAIKVLPPHLGALPGVRERFLREARTAAQLSHPNIVPIYRAEEVGGYAYFTMGYIDGQTLAERVRDRGPLPPQEVVRTLRESAWALAYAHARGVVHRDIKAANIMLERATGRAVVTDFGIARDQSASSLTQQGEVVGTVHYMSPEQANGQPLDGRSDLYSLGVAGFYALSGRLPFEGDNATAVLVAVASRQAPSLATVSSTVPRPLVEVIDRCLAREPEARFLTGEALADALALALERSATQLATVNSADRVVPEDQAQAIWLRAAQLQAEAASRLQLRSQEGGLIGLSQSLPTGGYRLKDVEQAAAEVGIAPEFVALALAEQPGDSAPGKAVVVGGTREDRRITRLLGTEKRSFSVSRLIKSSPKLTLEAIGRVFTARPYLLRLRDTVGGHPFSGGVLVFDVPNIMKGGLASAGTLESYTSFTYRMYQLELFQLNVTMRPVSGAGGTSTEVTIYGDLRPGLRKNLVANYWIAGALGASGAAIGGGVSLAALGLGALAALPALGGAALFGGLSLAGYRLLYPYALRKAEEELEGMMAAIESNIRSVQVFGAAPVPEPPPPVIQLDGGMT